MTRLPPLTGLSFWRVGDHRHSVPPSRDNAERLRLFRLIWPAQPGNAYPWRFRSSPHTPELIRPRNANV